MAGGTGACRLQSHKRGATDDRRRNGETDQYSTRPYQSVAATGLDRSRHISPFYNDGLNYNLSDLNKFNNRLKSLFNLSKLNCYCCFCKGKFFDFLVVATGWQLFTPMSAPICGGFMLRLHKKNAPRRVMNPFEPRWKCRMMVKPLRIFDADGAAELMSALLG